MFLGLVSFIGEIFSIWQIDLMKFFLGFFVGWGEFWEFYGVSADFPVF